MSETILKRLACPDCGSPLDQRSAATQAVVCPTCGSHVAIGSGDPEKLGDGRRPPRSPVPIELGDTATFGNVEHVVLGRVVYRGWSQHDSSDQWTWHEWMVGTSDGRMLWLTHDEKGFAIYRKLRIREAFDPMSDWQIPIGNGQTVRVHERYPAEIIGAEGELTWRATPGEAMFVAEGANHNRRYSVQKTAEEFEFHEGIPYDERDVALAFGKEDWAARVKRRASSGQTRTGVAVLCLIFAVLGFVGAIVASGTGEVAQSQQLQLSQAQPVGSVPVVFDMVERPAIVQVSLPGQSLPENSVVDLDVNVIAPNGERTYLFAQELWHETGVSEGEFWRETQYRTSELFVPMETGEHQLEFTYDAATSTAQQNLTLSVIVQRNHVMPNWLVVYAIISAILGFWLLFFGRSSS